MSRIGNKAVEIPDKVKVNVGDGGQVSVEGPKGKLQWTLPHEIRASVQDNRVSVVREAETRSAAAHSSKDQEKSCRHIATAATGSSFFRETYLCASDRRRCGTHDRRCIDC